MKILITSDWQLEDGPSLDHLDDRGRSIRFQENIEHIRGILDAGIREGCELMVHGGDLTEHSNPRSTESEAAAELFRHWIGNSERKILGVPGNHDGKIFDISSSSFAPLEKMSQGNLSAPHTPTSFMVEGVQLTLLPYLHGKTTAEIELAHEKAIEGTEKGTKCYLFMHYGVSEAVVGPKNLILPGDKLPASALFLGHYEAIFAGHIHKQQVIYLNNGKRKVPVIFNGSPGYCDFGERNDNKGYAILDTKTGEWKLYQVEPKRRWVQAEWPIDWPPVGNPLWNEGDIVKIAGEHPRGMDARAEMERLYKEGLPHPFATSWAVVPQRTARVDRGEEVAKANSLLDAATELGVKLFSQEDQEELLAEALKLVADKLREGRKAPLDLNIRVHRLEAADFMTYGHLKLDDMSNGIPTLVAGPNGLGKTNLMEAILFALSGKTSKGLNIGDLVRQGQKKATLTIVLGGDESMLTIERTITKNAKSGAGTQKLTATVETTEHDHYTLDGTVPEVQRNLDELLGSSYLSLKACNFMFQKDPSPFTKAEPGDRKKILADVLCLEPVLRAHKSLNDERLVKQRVYQDAEQSVRTAAAYKPTEERDTLVKDLGTAEARVNAATRSSQDAQQAFQAAQRAEETAMAASRAAQQSLQALPDPLPKLAASRQALTSGEEAFQANKEKERGVWRGLKDKLKALDLQPAVELDVLRAAQQATEVKVNTLESNLTNVRALVNTAASANAVAVAEVNRCEDALKKVKGTLEGTCSQCGQTITREHLLAEESIASEKLRVAKLHVEATGGDVGVRFVEEKNAATALEEGRRELRELNEKINQAVQAQTFRKGIEDQIARIEALFISAKDEWATKSTALTAQIAELEREVAAAEQKKTDALFLVNKTQKEFDDLVVVRLQAGHKKDQCVSFLNTENAAYEQLKTKLSDLEKWEALTKENEKRMEEAKLNSDIASMACAIVDPKGGLPVYLVDVRIPYLEERANFYMEKLGMADLRVSLSTVEEDKETLAVLVDNGFEPRLDIRAFSGGQLDRVEVAIKMALADLAADTRGSKLGLLCYDEPTGGLDESGKEALAAILFEKAAAGYPATYIVSHDPRMSEAFSRRLSVMKAPDGSTTVVAG